MRPLPNDRAGCPRSDCPRSSECWRFVGAKLRESDRLVMNMFVPENCEYFLEIIEGTDLP